MKPHMNTSLSDQPIDSFDGTRGKATLFVEGQLEPRVRIPQMHAQLRSSSLASERDCLEQLCLQDASGSLSCKASTLLSRVDANVQDLAEQAHTSAN